MLVNTTNSVEKRYFIESQRAGLVFSNACKLTQWGEVHWGHAAAQSFSKPPLSFIPSIEVAPSCRTTFEAHARPRRDLFGQHLRMGYNPQLRPFCRHKDRTGSMASRPQCRLNAALARNLVRKAWHPPMP